MNQITAYLNAHPNFRSAIRVFAYTFLATFIPALLGFLGDVLDWANTDGAAFPNTTTLGKALVSAVTSTIAAALAYAYNKLPIGASSAYTPSNAAADAREDRGEGAVITLAAVAVIVVAVVWLLSVYR